ncbi:HAMP domain-containing histidine kinase [Pelagibius litoralis]|uniref:histidine kinase n=1 Tax=Pelagibius litoralis TaxID=374515 RepID=A0A967KCA5_9PROT|nr:HAMP domain-containing sensor histidine kinase [Pelagibius litoralis]NIA71562.1 HAMP domain-containing histidine kinase [Pelagibius litoralis]
MSEPGSLPKRKPWSIARRLISVLTLTFAGFWLLAMIAAAAIVDHEINEVFDSALQETAQRLFPLVLEDIRQHDDAGGRGTLGKPLEFAQHEEYLVYQLRDAQGLVLKRSHDAPRQAFPVALQRGHAEAGGWRFFTEHYASSGLFLHVGERLTHRREAVFETLAWLAAPLGLLIPLVAMAVFWTVRHSLVPVAEVRAAMDARGGANLSPISDATLPEELSPIVQDVNSLLARLEQALASERAFATNSAHELRTPVAAALAQTQRLAAQLENTPERSRVEQLALTLKRLSDLVERLLQLARAEAGIARSREAIDVLPVLKLVVDEFARKGAVGERLNLDDGGHRRLMARIDIDALGIILRNLIDNALFHGTADKPVEIRVDGSGAIHVANACTVVPPARLARLMNRFERGGATVAGAGLGLAIVEALLSQSGGSLELRSPAAGRNDGFEAVLRLDLCHCAAAKQPYSEGFG